MLGWEGPTTHRQFLAFERWKADEADSPTPEHYYLMQVACEVRRGYAKSPRQVRLKDFRLRFGTPKAVKRTAQSVELSKQVWLSRMTMKPVVVQAGGGSNYPPFPQEE